MENEPVKLAYTVNEAAEAAGVSRPTMYQWTKRQDFPVAKIGGCTRIPVQAFQAWLEKQARVAENG